MVGVFEWKRIIVDRWKKKKRKTKSLVWAKIVCFVFVDTKTDNWISVVGAYNFVKGSMPTNPVRIQKMICWAFTIKALANQKEKRQTVSICSLFVTWAKLFQEILKARHFFYRTLRLPLLRPIITSRSGCHNMK